MAVAVSIAIASYLPAAVPAVVAVMIVPYCVRVVAPAVVAIMVVPYCAWIVAPARIIAQTRVIGSPPLPIFPLAFTAQPVELDIVIVPLRQPLAIGVIIVSAPVIRATAVRASVIRTRVVPVLGAPGKCQRSQDKTRNKN
jgi:hypothetical protein